MSGVGSIEAPSAGSASASSIHHEMRAWRGSVVIAPVSGWPAALCGDVGESRWSDCRRPARAERRSRRLRDGRPGLPRGRRRSRNVMRTKTRSRLEPARGRDDELRVRRGAVRFLAVPAHRFVALDGEGPPTPQAFETRMPGLYATAYVAHFALKRRGLEARVGPLEGCGGPRRARPLRTTC